jgi:hypothetical protein
MKKVMLLNAIALLFLCMSVTAQKRTSDSLALVSKIDADQIKLQELESQLDLRKMSQQEAIAKAHRSAGENLAAADKLSDNPKNKKLAKRAHKNAGEAREDAKNARKETERINKLNKEIKSTKKRLAKNQSRLDKYAHRGSVITTPPAPTQN